MGEILGLTVSHFPFLRFKPYIMPGVLRGLMSRGWADTPELRDPANWPAEMREEWGPDGGDVAGKEAQLKQIEQYHKLESALADFKPDVMVIMYRDLRETWKDPKNHPKYWVHTQPEIPVRFYQIFGMIRENYVEEDPDKVDTIKTHTEAAQLLLKGLNDRNLPAIESNEAGVPLSGLGHNALAGIYHLDWTNREFKTPVVAIGIDTFGFQRERGLEGLSEWDKSAPPPLTPKEAFELGQTIAQIFKASNLRVALVASTNWSNSQNTWVGNKRVRPEFENDIKRFEEWKNNQFDKWGDSWTFEEMEDTASWEILTSIVLAGAMTEIGAKVKHADLQTTWTLNSDWISTIFEAK
ncbi:MAG: hypothetical protein O2812_05535 [Chloroflexi bacterium]|nr:hypothetical protein [Chloroflexota bacterium]